MRASAGLLSFVSAAYTQQIYLDTNLGPNESRCSVQPNYTAPAYSFSTFAYTQNATRRTATSVAKPTSTTTYAPPYEELSTLLLQSQLPHGVGGIQPTSKPQTRPIYMVKQLGVPFGKGQILRTSPRGGCTLILSLPRRYLHRS